jgi:hypothetical protein
LIEIVIFYFMVIEFSKNFSCITFPGVCEKILF